MNVHRFTFPIAAFLAAASGISGCNGSGESWIDEPAPIIVQDVAPTPDDHTDATAIDRVETAVTPIDASIDAGDAMRDVSSTDVLMDTAVDAVSDSVTDVPIRPPVDAGDGSAADSSVPGNDTCTAPIDVTNGGVFAGTTCGAHDDARFTCGSAGTPDVFFTYTTRSPSDTVFLTVTPDTFALEFERPCGQGHNGCGTGTNSLGSSGESLAWAIGVESTVAGACGPFTLTVTRSP